MKDLILLIPFPMFINAKMEICDNSLYLKNSKKRKLYSYFFKNDIFSKLILNKILFFQNFTFYKFKN